MYTDSDTSVIHQGQRDRQTDKQTSRQADKQTSRQADKQTSRQADKQTSRQADKQTDRDSWTYRQTYIQTDRRNFSVLTLDSLEVFEVRGPAAIPPFWVQS
jgi:hypothetical protein